jgi:hypothetical protein
VNAKESLLDRVISVEIKATPVKRILKAIEEKGDVKFSYNPELIDENKKVDLIIKEKTIREGLSEIFDGTVRFKEVGNHIVLLQNESKEQIKERKKENADYNFQGKITDKRTGLPIAGASIYDVEARYAAVSYSNGRYQLMIPKEESVRSLYFKKKGYEAKVIVVSADKEAELVNNIALIPIETDINKIGVTAVEKVEVPIEERALSGALVSEDTYIHSENLEEIDEIRIAQISLVPSVSIGSNLSTNGLITNRFSLNILAGYSNGVEGFEVGSILNMTKGNVNGVQIGGISNLVGGDVEGMQAAGIANLIQGNFKGAQVSGISGIVKRDFKGVQASGISSIVRGSFTGIQFSGINNVAFKNSYGFQFAGIANTVFDTLVGGQISGIANFALAGSNFVQVSGITNVAEKNYGVQATGILNIAKHNSGLQLGLINLSKSSTGIAVGLFNYVHHGYHKTELAANELFPLNLTFKSGVQRLYNTYHFGVKFGPNRAYAAGIGFGSYFKLGEKMQISVDVSGDLAFETSLNVDGFSQLYKLSTTFDLRLAKWVTLFGGPSFNVNVMQFKNDTGDYSSNLAFNPFYSRQFTNAGVQCWFGGQIGFRF